MALKCGLWKVLQHHSGSAFIFDYVRQICSFIILTSRLYFQTVFWCFLICCLFPLLRQYTPLSPRTLNTINVWTDERADIIWCWGRQRKSCFRLITMFHCGVSLSIHRIRHMGLRVFRTVVTIIGPSYEEIFTDVMTFSSELPLDYVAVSSTTQTHSFLSSRFQPTNCGPSLFQCCSSLLSPNVWLCSAVFL